MNSITQILLETVLVVSPLLIVLMGELLLQRSGMVNLGLNGILLFSAVFGFFIYQKTSSIIVAFLASILIGIVFNLVLGFLNVKLKLPILSTGFVLAILGQNMAELLGDDLVFGVPTIFAPLQIPGLKDIPFLGPVFFNQNAWVFFAHLIVLGTWLWVFKSRQGKILIGLGDNADGLLRRGFRINNIRFAYLFVTGLLTGLAGFLYVFMVDVGWRGVYASYDGIGWFVIVLLMVGNWRPGKTLLFAYLYTLLSLALQLYQSSQTMFLVPAFNLIPQALIIIYLVLRNFGKRNWMITPIRKILSQEFTYIKRFSSGSKPVSQSELNYLKNQES